MVFTLTIITLYEISNDVRQCSTDECAFRMICVMGMCSRICDVMNIRENVGGIHGYMSVLFCIRMPYCYWFIVSIKLGISSGAKNVASTIVVSSNTCFPPSFFVSNVIKSFIEEIYTD